MDAVIARTLIDAILDWFHDHYEDPAENMPCDGGDYVWLCGEHYATDVLAEEFPWLPSEVTIAVVTTLWGECFSWVSKEEVAALLEP